MRRGASAMKQLAPTAVLARLIAAVLLCVGLGGAHAAMTDVDPTATSLRDKYNASQDRLAHNQFKRAMFLDSTETSESENGDIYALLEHPFAVVRAALVSPGNWCDILSLHLNTKYCRASVVEKQDVLNVSIGRKYDQPLEDAYPLLFAYRIAVQTPDYLQVRLNADKGPLDTGNYRIVLEAVPLKDGQTFIHLSYAYAYGLAGRLAMQSYLATIGKDKVGFTIDGLQASKQPLYIGGNRGLIERNTMRYFLAIDAFLGALSGSVQARFEQRIHDWFVAVERYPRQLHEMEQDEYLTMKRKEYRRQAEVP
jgi:hypothetical protein